MHAAVRPQQVLLISVVERKPRSLLDTEKHLTHSPQHMRRERWSPEPPETEWPVFHLQTDDCPPMSEKVREKIVNYG